MGRGSFFSWLRCLHHVNFLWRCFQPRRSRSGRGKGVPGWRHPVEADPLGPGVCFVYVGVVHVGVGGAQGSEAAHSAAPRPAHKTVHPSETLHKSASLTRCLAPRSVQHGGQAPARCRAAASWRMRRIGLQRRLDLHSADLPLSPSLLPLALLSWPDGILSKPKSSPIPRNIVPGPLSHTRLPGPATYLPH